MQRVVILLIQILLPLFVAAQEPTEEPQALVFEEMEWNFGQIEESDGIQSHTFRYRNTSDHFVAIERVYSSCGCTSGDYSRRSLKPSGEGEFVVNFDPTGTAGKIDKSVTIISDKGKGRTILRIRGRVNPRVRSVADLYPYDLGGGIRSDASYRSFGNIAQGATRSMTIALFNDARRTRTLSFEWVRQSGTLEVNIPNEIEPGESALATLTYAPSNADTLRYGMLIDEWRLVVNGDPSPVVFRNSAVGVDNFDNSSDDVPIPRAEIEPVYHDLGDVAAGESRSVPLTIRNAGDAPLIIRAITLREGTSLNIEAGESIAPGESLTRTLTLTIPSFGYDTLYGGAMLTLNDPRKPVRELRISANVIN